MNENNIIRWFVYLVCRERMETDEDKKTKRQIYKRIQKNMERRHLRSIGAKAMMRDQHRKERRYGREHDK